MSYSQVSEQLANSLHDASLRELHIDLSRGSVSALVDLVTGLPDAATEPEREARSACWLRFDGVTSLLVEPPHEGYSFDLHGGVNIDGELDTETRGSDPFARLSLYVSSWNSRIEIAARSCSIQWLSANATREEGSDPPT